MITPIMYDNDDCHDCPNYRVCMMMMMMMMITSDTSRSREDGEIDHSDYHFVSRWFNYQWSF